MTRAEGGDEAENESCRHGDQHREEQHTTIQCNGFAARQASAREVGAGQIRQVSPTQHPFKKAGVASGFTVEIVVKSGQALAAAQVVSTGTNDPAFIAGVAR